jgi:hypothetical protein
MWHVFRTRKICRAFCWETLEEREHWEHLGVEGMVYLTVVKDLEWDMEWINLRSWLFWDVTWRRLRVWLVIRIRWQLLVNRVTKI